MSEVVETSTTLTGVVNTDMISDVLNEFVELLPAVVPAPLVFIGLRKSVSFVRNTLHSA